MASRQWSLFLRRLLLIPALILIFAPPLPATVYAAEARCDPDGFAWLDIEMTKRHIQGALDAGMAEDELIDRINSNLRPKNESEADLSIKVASIVSSVNRGPRHDAANIAYGKFLKLCVEETATGRN